MRLIATILTCTIVLASGQAETTPVALADGPDQLVDYSVRASWQLDPVSTQLPTAVCARGIGYDGDGRLYLAHLISTAFGQCTGPARLSIYDEPGLSSTGPENLGIGPPLLAMAVHPSTRDVYISTGETLYRFVPGSGQRAEPLWQAMGSSQRPQVNRSLTALAIGPDDLAYGVARAGVSRYGLPSRRWAPWAMLADGQALAPTSLTLDTSGRVYLFDGALEQGIFRFNSTGTFDSNWRPADPAPSGATSIASGPIASFTGPGSVHDDLYVFEAPLSGEQHLRRMTTAGQTLELLPIGTRLELASPPYVAVGPIGEYAVAGSTESGGEALVVHAADGSQTAVVQLRERSAPSPIAGQVSWRQYGAVSAASGVFAAAQPHPGATRFFDPDGRELANWPTTGSLVDMALAPDGSTITFHGVESRLERRSATGELTWAVPYTGPAGAGLAADGRLVYISDAMRGLISLVDLETGSPVGVLGEWPRTTTGPHDVAALGGVVASLDGILDTVTLWDLNGPGDRPSARLQLAADTNASILALGPDRIAVGGGQVQVYDFAGTLLADLSPPDLIGEPGAILIDLAFDEEGRLGMLTAERQTQSAGQPLSMRLTVVEGSDSAAALPKLPVPPPAPAPLPAEDGLCRSTGDKTATPSEIWLGETVTVTLTLAGTCPGQPAAPADIVLILDVSGSMRNASGALGAAAHAFIAGIDLSIHRIGVVTFNQAALLRQPLTHDRDTLNRLPRNFGANGGTNIAVALDIADNHLQLAGRPEAQPVVVLMSDGVSQAVPAITKAQSMLVRGVHIYTVAFGGADEALLISIAGDPARFYRAITADQLTEIYEQIAQAINAGGRGVLLDDYLGADMEFVAGSSSMHLWAPPNELLRWRVGPLPPAPITITYRLLPTTTGLLPTNRIAHYDYDDADGSRRRFTYPVPYVLVRDRVPTPEPTPTPTPTPVPMPGTIYLPATHKHFCLPATQPADIVLVVDISSSMTGQPLQAAVQAAKAFVALLDLTREQAAVIAYDAEALVLAPLGSDTDALISALDSLRPGFGTRIDAALVAAEAELAQRWRSQRALPVVVLLSDGRHNGPPTEVSAISDRMLASGVTIYTIALGDEADLSLLTTVAGAPARALLAPAPDDLAAVYAAIAGRVICR